MSLAALEDARQDNGPTFSRPLADFFSGARSLTSAEVDLAQTQPFHIGYLEVFPQLREICAGQEREKIEPRVMQVLIALAETGGAVVSRDELINRCWGGRAISEDALNRVIAKVRNVAKGLGRGEFRIETITKVGYRLIRHSTEIAADVAETVPKAASHQQSRSNSRWLVMAAGIILVAIAGWTTLRWLGGGGPQAPARTSALVSAPAPPVGAAADLETRGLSAVFEGPPERVAEGIGYLRQATILAPRRAGVWGSLAMAYVLSLAYTPQNEQAAVVARIGEAARHAQLLDPREGRSIAAVVSLEPTYGNWIGKDASLQKALSRAAPNTAPLMFQRVQFLANVGRTRDALKLVEELSAFSPYLPWIQSARANLLAANGRPEEAERVAARASEIWPRERLTWFTRFYLAAYSGKPREALAFAADRSNWPYQADPGEVELAIRIAEALVSGAPSDAERLMMSLRPLAQREQRYAEQGIRAALALGKTEDAMQFAVHLVRGQARPQPRGLFLPRIGLDGPKERTTAVLFSASADGLWRMPGFMPLMKETGLLDYWQRTVAPDFCTQPSMAICPKGQSRL